MKKKLYVINNSIITFDSDFMYYLRRYTIPCKRDIFADNVPIGKEYELSAEIIQAALDYNEGKVEVVRYDMAD